MSGSLSVPRSSSRPSSPYGSRTAAACRVCCCSWGSVWSWASPGRHPVQRSRDRQGDRLPRAGDDPGRGRPDHELEPRTRLGPDRADPGHLRRGGQHRGGGGARALPARRRHHHRVDPRSRAGLHRRGRGVLRAAQAAAAAQAGGHPGGRVRVQRRPHGDRRGAAEQRRPHGAERRHLPAGDDGRAADRRRRRTRRGPRRRLRAAPHRPAGLGPLPDRRARADHGLLRRGRAAARFGGSWPST